MDIDVHASARRVALLMGSIVLSACTATAALAGPQARIIVQFRPGGSPPADPADPAFRARLAAAAGVGGIELIRPMSGDAWVMMLDCTDPREPSRAVEADACSQALRRLAATEWIRHVEPDARAGHQ